MNPSTISQSLPQALASNEADTCLTRMHSDSKVSPLKDPETLNDSARTSCFVVLELSTI
jgi:hypothetical protein